MNKPEFLSIEDVQNTPDHRQITINHVGIKGIKHPIRFSNPSLTTQHTVAVFNMYVSLPSQLKGTHMSRFIEILNDGLPEISISSLPKLLHTMISRLEANAGLVEISFPIFINKQAPVSLIQSLMDYEVTLIGEIQGSHYTQQIKVVVPVTSLCPCSKRISAYGAHNQRSHITVTASILQPLEIEELLTLIENQASSQLYGLLKRTDEKFVTEWAYDHPKFVEDLVRDVAVAIKSDRRIGSYKIECENFESIHNHSAYASISSNGQESLHDA